MAICDRHGLPVAVHVASASPYEPHLVPATVDARFLADLPTRLIGDRGYDSDALDERLMTQYGIEMIAAHRRGRRSTQDGRALRRTRRRWKIERLFACSTTRVVSSRAGNVMSTTSWACCISPAPESSSGIYEMTSSLLRRFQWTGILADGKKTHMNKVPCHTDLAKTLADFVVLRYGEERALWILVHVL